KCGPQRARSGQRTIASDPGLKLLIGGKGRPGDGVHQRHLATWDVGTSAIGVAAKQVAGAAEHGAAPATSPLSYRQLNANHGPRFHGWYCRCVVWLNSSSWSMRKTSFPTGMMGNPATCGRKKRAATPDITTNAVSPWKSGTLTRIA